MRRLALLPLLTLALACNDGAVLQPDATQQPGQDLPGIAASSHSSGVVASVTGSGHFTTAPPAFLPPGLWRTFTFTARKYADGSVKGSFNNVVHLEDGGVDKTKGPITCFTIVGNKVWIGGEYPDRDPPDGVWQMVDNGEGAGALNPDQAGLQLSAQTFGWPAGYAQWFCDNTPDTVDSPVYGSFGLDILLFDIESGNIQIR